ncbi:Vacuolar protein sorting-associated protein, partial [Cryptosporidium felis]
MLGYCSKITEKVLYSTIKNVMNQIFTNFEQEQLSISLLGGSLEIRDLNIRKELFASVSLPISLSDGIVGKVNIDIIWRKIFTQEFVKIRLDDVYLIFNTTDVKTWKIEMFENNWKNFKANLLKQDEFITFLKSNVASSFLRRFGHFFISKIQLEINNIHFRIENKLTQYMQKFVIGLSIDNISSRNCNEYWIPTDLQSSPTSGNSNGLGKSNVQNSASSNSSSKPLREIEVSQSDLECINSIIERNLRNFVSQKKARVTPTLADSQDYPELEGLLNSIFEKSNSEMNKNSGSMSYHDFWSRLKYKTPLRWVWKDNLEKLKTRQLGESPTSDRDKEDSFASDVLIFPHPNGPGVIKDVIDKFISIKECKEIEKYAKEKLVQGDILAKREIFLKSFVIENFSIYVDRVSPLEEVKHSFWTHSETQESSISNRIQFLNAVSKDEARTHNFVIYPHKIELRARLVPSIINYDENIFASALNDRFYIFPQDSDNQIIPLISVYLVFDNLSIDFSESQLKLLLEFFDYSVILFGDFSAGSCPKDFQTFPDDRSCIAYRLAWLNFLLGEADRNHCEICEIEESYNAYSLIKLRNDVYKCLNYSIYHVIRSCSREAPDSSKFTRDAPADPLELPQFAISEEKSVSEPALPIESGMPGSGLPSRGSEKVSNELVQFIVSKIVTGQNEYYSVSLNMSDEAPGSRESSGAPEASLSKEELEMVRDRDLLARQQGKPPEDVPLFPLHRGLQRPEPDSQLLNSGGKPPLPRVPDEAEPEAELSGPVLPVQAVHGVQEVGDDRGRSGRTSRVPAAKAAPSFRVSRATPSSTAQAPPDLATRSADSGSPSDSTTTLLEPVPRFASSGGPSARSLCSVPSREAPSSTRRTGTSSGSSRRAGSSCPSATPACTASTAERCGLRPRSRAPSERRPPKPSPAESSPTTLGFTSRTSPFRFCAARGPPARPGAQQVHPPASELGLFDPQVQEPPPGPGLAAGRPAGEPGALSEAGGRLGRGDHHHRPGRPRDRGNRKLLLQLLLAVQLHKLLPDPGQQQRPRQGAGLSLPPGPRRGQLEPGPQHRVPGLRDGLLRGRPGTAEPEDRDRVRLHDSRYQGGSPVRPAVQRQDRNGRQRAARRQAERLSGEGARRERGGAEVRGLRLRRGRLSLRGPPEQKRHAPRASVLPHLGHLLQPEHPVLGPEGLQPIQELHGGAAEQLGRGGAGQQPEVRRLLGALRRHPELDRHLLLQVRRGPPGEEDRPRRRQADLQQAREPRDPGEGARGASPGVLQAPRPGGGPPPRGRGGRARQEPRDEGPRGPPVPLGPQPQDPLQERRRDPPLRPLGPDPAGRDRGWTFSSPSSRSCAATWSTPSPGSPSSSWTRAGTPRRGAALLGPDDPGGLRAAPGGGGRRELAPVASGLHRRPDRGQVRARERDAAVRLPGDPGGEGQRQRPAAAAQRGGHVLQVGAEPSVSGRLWTDGGARPGEPGVSGGGPERLQLQQAQCGLGLPAPPVPEDLPLGRDGLQEVHLPAEAGGPEGPLPARQPDLQPGRSAHRGGAQPARAYGQQRRALQRLPAGGLSVPEGVRRGLREAGGRVRGERRGPAGPEVPAGGSAEPADPGQVQGGLLRAARGALQGLRVHLQQPTHALRQHPGALRPPSALLLQGKGSQHPQDLEGKGHAQYVKYWPSADGRDEEVVAQELARAPGVREEPQDVARPVGDEDPGRDRHQVRVVVGDVGLDQQRDLGAPRVAQPEVDHLHVRPVHRDVLQVEDVVEESYSDRDGVAVPELVSAEHDLVVRLQVPPHVEEAAGDLADVGGARDPRVLREDAPRLQGGPPPDQQSLEDALPERPLPGAPLAPLPRHPRA